MVGNAVLRVGADASQLTSEMQKAQNTITTFKNETMASLKSFGMPTIATTDLVASITSGQRVIVDFAQESGESLAQFQERVRTTFQEAGIDVTQYEEVLNTATSVHAEFAKGAVKSFQATTDAAQDSTSKIGGYFNDFSNSVQTAFSTMSDSSASFGDKIGAVTDAVNSGFEVMGGAVTAFLAIEVVKTVGDWISSLQNLASETQDVQDSFNASMGLMDDKATEFSTNLSKNLGVSLNTIRDEMGKEYLNTRMLGFDPAQAETMSENLTKLSFDLGKLRGEDPSAVFDKLEAGVEGQAKGLSELGIRITDADLKQRALNEGLIKQGQTMSDETKSLMIYQDLMQKTTGINGYYSTTMDTISTQQTKLNTQFEEMGVELATALTPAFEGVLQVLNVLAEGLGVFVTVISDVIKAIEILVEDLYTLFTAIRSLDFSSFNKDLQANYDSVYNASDASAAFGKTLDTTTGSLGDNSNAANGAATAHKNLSEAANANVQSFDQVHNLSNQAASGLAGQAAAVNDLANALNNLALKQPSLSVPTGPTGPQKAITIPIAFGKLPAFPTLPTPPAITVTLDDQVTPALQETEKVIKDWEAETAKGFEGWVDTVSKDLANWSGKTLGELTGWATKAKVAVNGWKTETENIFSTWGKAAATDIGVATKALVSLDKLFNTNINSVKDWASTVESNFVKGAKSIENSLVTAFDKVLNFIKSNPILSAAIGLAGAAGLTIATGGLDVVAAGGAAAAAAVATAPGFADGAIVTAPTFARVAESGPEAIIPLSQLGGTIGNTANQPTTTTNANQPINVTLNLDGRKLARILYQYNINEVDRIGTIQGYNSSFNYPK